MRNLARGGLAAACLVVSACASTPDMEIGYYLPRGELALTGTRTVGCDARDKLHSTTSVTPAMTFSRDPDHPRQVIDLGGLSSATANSDVTVTYKDDGRLSGINASSTGVGGEIVSKLIEIAGAFGIPAPPRVTMQMTEEEICEQIEAVAGDGKPVTLTYIWTEPFTSDRERNEKFKLDGGGPSFGAQVDRMLDPLCVQFEPAQAVEPIGPKAGAGTNYVHVSLRQPATVAYTVYIGTDGGCTSGQSMLSGEAPVPQRGTDYSLPIPQAAFFGGQEFALALSDAGTVTSLQYGHDSGGPAMLGAVAAAAGAVGPASAAERAKEANSQADLIVAQQRLIRCRIEPAACE